MRTLPPEIAQPFDQARASLIAAFRSAVRDLDALLADLLAREIPTDAELTDPLAAAWLEEPAGACRRIRPVERLLEAVADYRRRCAEMARASSPAREPLTQILPDWLDEIERREGRRWGRLVATTAQAMLETLAPWALLRRAALRAAAGAPGRFDPQQAGAQWRSRVRELRLRLERILADLASHRLAPLPRRPRSAGRRRKVRALLDRRLAWWERHREAAAATLALELALWKASRRLDSIIEAALEQLEQERDEWLRELDGLIGWLEGAGGEPPARRAGLLSPENRVRHWREDAGAAVRELVPAQLEVAARWSPLPDRRSPWRLIRPQSELLDALDQAAQPVLLSIFEEAESLHRGALQDTERARQVIAFSREIAQREGESGRAAAREALENTLALLRHRKQALPELRPLAAPAARQASAAALYRVHLKLERDRFGLWGYLAREGAQQAATFARDRAVRALRQAIRAAEAGWRRLSDFLLARIGWERIAAPATAHVERREILSETLGVDLAPRGLSLIYQRLFQPEPVEDPRFLIGREAEMAAMAELRRLWEQGRAACALVVGERGSGKTSLLNCACAQIFPDAGLVRAQFEQRIGTADAMRRFLEERLALDAGRRAVVVLEELERAFLRCVGGFDGFRELLRTIVATSGKWLWIVAMNRAAFQLLDAALGLARYFSHRVNAAAVERRHLEEAILMRHHLTGLRLHFLAPPQSQRRRGRWRARLGLRVSPRQAFFDALYRESEGLFRSAFELWLRHIERSEAGVLYVRPLEVTNYESLLADLTLAELFTLQALLQHGSLTAEEHAAVLGLNLRASQDRLELLEDRELLQPDPGRAGYRVRPEAARAVRVALHRSNLL